MILKLWIIRLHKNRIWLIHGTRLTIKHIPPTRYRQSNCTTNKFTNPNNCNSSRRTTLLNCTKTRSKNRRHTGATKPSEILNQPPWYPIRTMLRKWKRHFGSSNCQDRTVAHLTLTHWISVALLSEIGQPERGAELSLHFKVLNAGNFFPKLLMHFCTKGCW